MGNDLLRTEFLGVQMKNPVIAASGTFGFGREYEEFFDPSILGGVSSKGLTLEPSRGNRGIRVWETPMGMLNSIGLENPGVEHFRDHEAKNMRRLGCAVIANLGGHSLEDYVRGAEILNDCDIDILELNISCPNVKSGGMAFGTDPVQAADVTSRVKSVTRHPLMVKLTPNAGDIALVARACEEAGADGLSLINTVLGMAIDVKAERAVFDNVYAGLSGPAVMPIALRMVHQVAKAVSIPVSGLGGIATAEDAIAFIMAGASTVQVGASTFRDPMAMVKIIRGMEEYAVKKGLKNIQDIRGIV